MDRKIGSVTNEVSILLDDIENLKTSQFSGSDTLVLRSVTTNSAFDAEFTLAPTQSVGGVVYFDYPPVLKQWQKSAYAEIYTQFYVDNLSTIYQGFDNSKIGVITLLKNDRENFTFLFYELYNNDTVNHTMYVKYYVVTSALGGTISLV